MGSDFTNLGVWRMSNGVSMYWGGNFCGPGWGYTRQDVENRTIAAIPEAVDAIDRACKAHDQCYADNGYFMKMCNVKLASDLRAIVLDPGETMQRRRDAYVMAAIFEIEARRLDWVLRPTSETYQALYVFMSGAWARTSRTMESVINEAYLRVCSQAAAGQGLSPAGVCR